MVALTCKADKIFNPSSQPTRIICSSVVFCDFVTNAHLHIHSLTWNLNSDEEFHFFSSAVKDKVLYLTFFMPTLHILKEHPKNANACISCLCVCVSYTNTFTCLYFRLALVGLSIQNT